MPSRRRARDEGSIGKRSDGRFMARLELGVGPKGQRRRKTVYGATKAEVVARLREVLKGTPWAISRLAAE